MHRENLEKILSLRHELHEYPELSGNETLTKRRLMKFLEHNTNFAVIDCGKWFYATRYVEGTKAIAFRADMDALPIDESINISHASKYSGISHKCGHDGHCAVLCGLALELDKLSCRRSVYLIFQHAEETGHGAREIAGFLRERNITEIYAFHNWSGWPEKSIVVRAGLCQCASMGMTVKIFGNTSHASEPEKGSNPAYVIAKLVSGIEILSAKYKSRKILCTVVNIKLGDKNFGISPGYGEVSLTIRAEHGSDMQGFYDDVVRNSESLVTGFNVEYEICEYFPETVSDIKCVRKIRSAAENLTLEIIDMPDAIRASEDFGYYTKQIQGAIFYVGNGENYPAIHTGEYDFNDNILETASDMFTEIYELSVK